MKAAGNRVLRLAGERDTADVVRVFRRARSEFLPFLPELHTLQETLQWFRRRELLRSVIWVAEVNGQVAGFSARENDWLHHLYVVPEHQGQGVGSQLLAKAKEESPKALRLYTFQANRKARSFYESRGFTNVELNQAGGEEQLPDVLMRWNP
ncbi:MAG TPA: GNAT family N-acetyltransferase [Dehalococcoidia bacterium]